MSDIIDMTLSDINPEYTEILILHKMLAFANIPHTIRRLYDGWQICYPSSNRNEMVCDVIEHYASIGHDSDTLEIMCNDDKVTGQLTAEEVFDYIDITHQKHIEREKENR